MWANRPEVSRRGISKEQRRRSKYRPEILDGEAGTPISAQVRSSPRAAFSPIVVGGGIVPLDVHRLAFPGGTLRNEANDVVRIEEGEGVVEQGTAMGSRLEVTHTFFLHVAIISVGPDLSFHAAARIPPPGVGTAFVSSPAIAALSDTGVESKHLFALTSRVPHVRPLGFDSECSKTLDTPSATKPPTHSPLWLIPRIWSSRRLTQHHGRLVPKPEGLSRWRDLPIGAHHELLPPCVTSAAQGSVAMSMTMCAESPIDQDTKVSLHQRLGRSSRTSRLQNKFHHRTLDTFGPVVWKREPRFIAPANPDFPRAYSVSKVNGSKYIIKRRG